MSEEKPLTALGTEWTEWHEQRREKSGRPIVLEAQDLPFIKLETEDEIRQWKEDVSTQFGITWDDASAPVIMAECGCCINGRYTSDRSDEC